MLYLYCRYPQDYTYFIQNVSYLQIKNALQKIFFPVNILLFHLELCLLHVVLSILQLPLP